MCIRDRFWSGDTRFDDGLGAPIDRGRPESSERGGSLEHVCFHEDRDVGDLGQAGEQCRQAASPVSYTHLDVYKRQVFRRGVAAAYCDTAGPLEEGGETSLAVAPTPDDWSPEQKASFYREYNTAMVTNLTVHEAMPGHMLQQAHARRFHGSTLVRKVLQSCLLYTSRCV